MASLTTEDYIDISGNVTIEGLIWCGKTISVSVSECNASWEKITIQWYRDGVAIEGATAASYTVTGEDMGKTLEVRLIGIDEYRGQLAAQVMIPDYIVGDVNSDGIVDDQDCIILTRYLAKWSGYDESMVNLIAADVSGDGKVNTQDRIILARHLAQWVGYEMLPAES